MAYAGTVRDFTTGSITKQLITFTIPLFLSNLLQIVYNMVDMIIVGNVLGEVGLSAVSVGGDLTNFMTFFCIGFAGAAQVIIAKYIGAHQQERASRFVGTMTGFLLTAALAVCTVCILLREPLLQVMNTPAESYAEALRYATVSMLGLVFIYGYNIIGAILRGLGDSRHPFLFISIAAVVNLLLDVVFVVGLRMGAGGAALATVLSQALSVLCGLVFIARNRKTLLPNICAADFVRWDKQMLGDLIGLGFPMAIKSAAIQFSKLFTNAWINSYGVYVSAFSGIANKINNISNLVMNAANTAGATMIAQNIGAKKADRVKRVLGRMFVLTLTTAAVLSAVVCLFPAAIFGLFTQEQTVLAIAQEYLLIAVLTFFGSACRACMNALINGSGNYRINFITAILDGFVMRIGLALFFGLALDLGYIGFWLGDALARFTPFVIGGVFYFTGSWETGRGKA